ncbi:MAG: HAD family hydrolase [Thermoanaerobaculia bacterium]|nr:HAD family hydrolase [Thermoanaerobaculia bacterium]
MHLEAVLLDMGGVLLDMRASNGVPPGRFDFRGRQALLGALDGSEIGSDDLERLVFAPWRREYRERYRRGREASWTPHLDRLRAAIDERRSDLELLEIWFAPFGESLRPVAGAPEAVEELAARGLRLGLVSNVPLPGALYRRVLERFGMAKSIEVFEFSYDSGHRKPSPYMLRSALEVLATSIDHAVMVGDRRDSDVVAGRTAGTATVWIRSDRDRGPEPDWAIDSIAQLPALLERSA